MPWDVLARWGRTTVGVTAGVCSAATGWLLPIAMVVQPAHVHRYARRVAEWELRRLAFMAGVPSPSSVAATSGRRVLAYLAARQLPAAIGALAIGVLAIGVVLAAVVIDLLISGMMSPASFLSQVVVGSALLVINLQAIASVAALDRWLARTLLQSSSRQALERRISELAVSRAEVLEAVDAERQRIERDLHDGLQQHLVALGMLLGRARRSSDPGRARELLAQAHDDVQRAVDELREVAWRVYPAALDHTTLDEVLTMVAQRSPIPVKIDYSLPVRPARPVETMLYFVACEAITNASKHSRASLITIEISSDDATTVAMRVCDDGMGGADPRGSGLRGLARRVTALDGRFEVHSPPGGPTVIRAELPCA